MSGCVRRDRAVLDHEHTEWEWIVISKIPSMTREMHPKIGEVQEVLQALEITTLGSGHLKTKCLTISSVNPTETWCDVEVLTHNVGCHVPITPRY